MIDHFQYITSSFPIYGKKALDISFETIDCIQNFRIKDSCMPDIYDARKHICFNLGRVMRKVYEHYESQLSSFGITPPQYFVFNALWMGDGISIGELCGRVSLDSSTITGIIDRLEKSGYVERRPNPQDRRSALVYLTTKARELAPEILKYADELDAKMRKRFSAKDMEVFETILRELGETQD
jgi:DNA-binding MarR family transcriptional regulator